MTKINQIKLMATVLIAVAVYVFVSLNAIIKLKKENSRLNANQEILLSENKVQTYKVADSLNAAKASELQLTLNEYKKYRAEDLQLIKKLKADKPKEIIKTVTETYTEIVAKLDTVYIDSTKHERHFSYDDKWTKVKGSVYDDSVKLDIKNNEELLVVENIQRKKFLFIKLPISIFGYKHKQIDVVSKNPHTQILSTEYITIK